ncbi:hypothetical protein E3Q23_03609 [Wallemia mellicola]|nr:hypothetical protein E3Q23_03609 [Wallemia mellicola]
MNLIYILSIITFTNAIRVAIVGSGAAGSTAAYYLTKAAEQNAGDVDIDVFEKRYVAGGRSRVVFPHNNETYDSVELGASIFVDANKNMVKAVNDFDFDLADKGTDDFGIYNGKNFVFKSSSWTYLDYVKLIWSSDASEHPYAFSITLLTKFIQVKQAIDKFLLLYNPEFIRNHGPWEHVDDMLGDLDMIDLVKEDALSYFTNSLFANEVVEAATRVNYGQNLDTIHALGALVSMAGSNGMSVEGGNYKIFERFLEESNAHVHFGSEVIDVQRSRNNQWEVYLTSGKTAEDYDYLILAAPLPIFQVPYVKLHVTLLTTNATTYADNALPGLGENPPTMILTTNEEARKHSSYFTKPSPLNFNSINYVQQAKEGSDEHVVKIFSEDDDAWSDGDLHSLFGGPQNVRWIHRHTFNAYPYLQPRKQIEDLPPFKIDEGLYYTNVMEPMISKQMINIAIIGSLLAGASAQVYPTGTMGPTNPMPTMDTAINQGSDARLLSINGPDDFCLILQLTSTGDVEGEVVAWCTKPRNNARLIPDGTITAVHYQKTPAFVQISALGDFTKVNVLSGDAGGELDPHGATGEGNPIGGNVTALVNGQEQSYEEWMSFQSDSMFCARICTNSPYNGWDAATWCQHELDEMGCEYVIPMSYEDGVFDSCDADAGFPPGVYPQDGDNYSTFHQYYEGTYTGGDGLVTSYTVGTTVTPTGPATTPASSNCTPMPSPSHGIDIANPTVDYPAAPTPVAQDDVRYDLKLHPSGGSECLGLNGDVGNDAALAVVSCDNAPSWSIKRGGPTLIRYAPDNNYCVDAGDNAGKVYTCYTEQPNQQLYYTDDNRIAKDGGLCLTDDNGSISFTGCTDNNQSQVFSA